MNSHAILLGQGSAPEVESDSLLLGERQLQWRVGAAGQFGLTSHNTTLDIYYGSPGCGEFTNQISGITALKLFGEIPLLRSPSISFTGGVTLQNRPVNFVEGFSHPARYANGAAGEVITQQRLDVSMSGIGISGGLLWEPFTDLRLGASPSLLFLSTSDLRQYEEIVTPLGAVFTETNDFQRPVNRGRELEFNNMGFEFSIWGGLRLPLGKQLSVLPEVGVSLLTTSLEKTYQWRTTTFHASIGIAWEKWGNKEEMIFDPPLLADDHNQVDTVALSVVDSSDVVAEIPDDTSEVETPPLPFLQASIKAVGVDDEGNEYPEPIIEIREAPWSRSIPLIPYLFFEKGKATIPERYVRFQTSGEAEKFHVVSLPVITTVALHHQLLNILGDRLRSRPEVSVTIVGTLSKEEGERDSSLGLRRAEAVQQYLKDVWEIDSRRVRIAVGDPSNPSSEETEEGRGENRRAEFVFDGESLLRPVVVERLASVASPPAIKFYPKAIADSTLVDWNITVYQGEKQLLYLDSTSSLDGTSDVSDTKYWPLGELRVNRDLTPIIYRLEVTDNTGQTAFAEDSFRVREHVTRTPEEEAEGDLQVKEYLLVGFGYNKAELRQEHRSEIYEIARAVEDGGWIEVTGFTDRVGDAEYNRELALQRARNVEKTLQEVRRRLSLPELLITNVRGSSEASDDVFDNNLPEGRIFSRMVRVTVNRQTKR
ncbi:MAG: OmpA family protein [Candidatus Kapaibacterium sp.]